MVGPGYGGEAQVRGAILVLGLEGRGSDPRDRPECGDIDELERFEPSEQAKRHKPSDVDAMGQDKRREVVGHSYGPSAP